MASQLFSLCWASISVMADTVKVVHPKGRPQPRIIHVSALESYQARGFVIVKDPPAGRPAIKATAKKAAAKRPARKKAAPRKGKTAKSAKPSSQLEQTESADTGDEKE